MKTKLKLAIISIALAFSGCVSYNRDALWNCPLNIDYCTYHPEQNRVGIVYVHMYDDWTEKRLRVGYELAVKQKLSEKVYILEYKWNVFFGRNMSNDAYIGNMGSHDPVLMGKSVSNYAKKRRVFASVNPIIVELLEDKDFKVGEFFCEYGQYVNEGTCTIEDMTFSYYRQINTKQEHTYTERSPNWNWDYYER